MEKIISEKSKKSKKEFNTKPYISDPLTALIVLFTLKSIITYFSLSIMFRNSSVKNLLDA